MAGAARRKHTAIARANAVAEAAYALNPRWRAFLRDFYAPGTETCGNLAACARKNGINERVAQRWWAEHRADPEAKGYVRALMEQNGVTDDRVFQKLADLLESADGRDVARGVELALKSRQIIAAPQSVQQVFVALGVQSQQELERIVQRDRERANLTLDEVYPDLVSAARLWLQEHPDRAGELRSAIFGEQEVEGE